MNTAPPPRRYLDTAEAADYLRMSPKWLVNGRSAGIGPTWIKLGSRVIYDVSALDEYMAAHTVEASA